LYEFSPPQNREKSIKIYFPIDKNIALKGCPGKWVLER
jgi:hypothetical protein